MEDGIVLSFTRNDLSDEEIESLAISIAKLESVSRATWRACRVASHTSPVLSAKLALAILKTLSADSDDQSAAMEQDHPYFVN